MSYVPPHLRKNLSESEKKEKEIEAVKDMSEKDFPALGGGSKITTASKWSSTNVVAWSEDADIKRREEEYIRSVREEKQRKKDLEDQYLRNSIPNFNRKPIFATPSYTLSTTQKLTHHVSEDDGWSEVKKPVRKVKTFEDRPPEEENHEDEDEDYDAEDY